MATIQQQRVERSNVTLLRRISYKDYCRLRENPANRHVRMTYNDGTLELVSPIKYEHEAPKWRLGLLIAAVTAEFGIAYRGTASMTFRRGGEGVYKGKGREPDQSFYIANCEFLRGRKTIDLDLGDPPPDLWIEVDNRASSRGRLPVYAGLEVPEVWRYRARKKSLTFLRLVDGAYQPIDRSLALPMLKPALVLEALALGGDIDDTAWDRQLRDWIRHNLGPRPAAD